MKKIMFNDRYGLTEAVLQGRKTVTRRLLKPTKPRSIANCLKGIKYECLVDEDGNNYEAPYYVGEIVAVAQRYEFVYSVKELRKLGFLHKKIAKNKMQVKSSLMPSKIRILDVRAERLQDITDEDCLREGICKATIGYYIKGIIANWEKESHTEHEDGKCYKLFPTPKEAFTALIDKISGKGTWDANPYVWRIEFELVK